MGMARPSEVTRGDVWTVDFGPDIGRHPAAVVSRTGPTRRRARAILALISSADPYGVPSEVAVGPEVGLTTDSWIGCDDLYTVGLDLLAQRLGALDPDRLAAVDAALHVALGLHH
jgi:mRNA-degrading endonuclease toxin of MazEF toxin-antitoxin module